MKQKIRNSVGVKASKDRHLSRRKKGMSITPSSKVESHKKQGTGLTGQNKGDCSFSFALDESYEEDLEFMSKVGNERRNCQTIRKRISIIDSDIPTNMSSYGDTKEKVLKELERSPFFIKYSISSSDKDESENQRENESVTLFDALIDSQSCMSGTRLSMITPDDICIRKMPKTSPQIITPFMEKYGKKAMAQSEGRKQRGADSCFTSVSYFTLSNCTPRGFYEE
ncbi:unnamed protein product [Moneuplotes crassus]|uniref:Uncharacterized protein n=1 Tax=Euplotes crassus TaxID=5936 RepID=A0AAD1XCC2_EUPCR|nr:unnamed protein product [Moneuplotes crassus]